MISETSPSYKAAALPVSRLPRPRMRPVDHDAYPTAPRAELKNLTNLLALSGSRSEDFSKPGLGIAQIHNAEEDEKGKGMEVDSGYSSQVRDEVSEHSRHSAGGARTSFSNKTLSTYGPTHSAREADVWWRTNDDERSPLINVEEAAQEQDLYDDQGFLIEAAEDLTPTMPLDREEQSIDLAPRIRECFPTLLFGGTNTFPPQARNSPHHHTATPEPPFTDLFPPSTLTLNKKDIGSRRTDSRFSFSFNVEEENLTAKRDVVDAEKRRRQRQWLCGLEGCDLTAQEEEERRLVLRGRGFVHTLGTSTTDYPQVPLGGDVQESKCLRHLEGLVHQLTSPQRSGHEEPVDWSGGSQGDDPVGWCTQCSSLHIGRRADAMDSVVEEIGFEPVRRTAQFGRVKDETTIMSGQQQLTAEDEKGGCCWSIRWLGCAADSGQEKREDGKGRLWECKPKAARRKLRKVPPGAVRAVRKVENVWG